MADLKPELISVLRDIRDIKYPDIVAKHNTIVAKEALVNPHYTAIDGVYAISTAVTNVNANATNINAVNANSTNINTNATNVASINTNATNIANINTTATNIAKVSTVSTDLDLGASSKIKTVADAIANVNTVTTNIGSVNTNATNIASINTNATNITAIQNASANAISALASKNSADADVVLTHADVVTCTAKAVIANQILNMTANASTLVSGSLASANYNPTTGIMSFGIPNGPKGDKGDAFVINALGTFAGRSAYDLQPKNFTYYATDIAEIYFKLSATSGDWSIGSPFGKGDTGDTGNGIASITKTGSVANVDKYRILYTDATFFDFNVTNGSVTSVAGRTGAITLTKTDVGLSNVDDTSDLLKPLSTAGINALALKANLASPTFTGTVVLPSTTSIGAITSTELSYIDGVTSSVQTQLNTKAPLASPALTGTPTAPTPTAGTNTTQVATTAFVLANSVNTLGDLGLTATATALNYVEGVTSAIQTQLNGKANLASPALTGTPTAPTATAGTNTTQLATTAFAIGAGVGSNQTWQSVTGSRARNTVYTNTSNKPIIVDITFSKTNSGEYGYIETESKHISKKQFEGGGTYAYNFQAIIGAGQTYKMVVPSITTLLEWNELR